MNNQATEQQKCELQPYYIDVRERSQGDGRVHHYIIQMGSDAKICEVFSEYNKQLILEALNRINSQSELEKLNQELVEACKISLQYTAFADIREILEAAIQRHANLKKEGA